MEQRGSGERREAEQLGPALAPIQDAGTAGGSLAHPAPVQVPPCTFLARLPLTGFAEQARGSTEGFATVMPVVVVAFPLGFFLLLYFLLSQR